MKAKSRRSSKAFAASSGTCRSSTSLTPSETLFARRGVAEVLTLPGGRRRTFHPADEAGGNASEGQFVAVLDALVVYGRAVEEGAVGRAQVFGNEAVLRAQEPGVLPRHVRILDDDVVLFGAADAPRSLAFQRVRAVLHDQLHRLPCEPMSPRFLGGDGGRSLIPPLCVASGLLGAEDTSLAGGVFRGALLAGTVAAGELGSHAELTEAQRVFGDEADPRRSHEMVVLRLGVGRGVLDQLVPQGALVGLDGLLVGL